GNIRRLGSGITVTLQAIGSQSVNRDENDSKGRGVLFCAAATSASPAEAVMRAKKTAATEPTLAEAFMRQTVCSQNSGKAYHLGSSQEFLSLDIGYNRGDPPSIYSVDQYLLFAKWPNRLQNPFHNRAAVPSGGRSFGAPRVAALLHVNEP